MFFTIIAGNLVAALFAFCGLAQVILYLVSDERPASATQFVSGMLAAAWPLAVAGLLFLLVQIASLLEKIYLLRKSEGTLTAGGNGKTPAASALPTAPKKKKEPENRENVFFRANAVPPPTPLAPTQEADVMDVKAAAAFAVAVAAERENNVQHETSDKSDVKQTSEEKTDDAPVLPEKPKPALSFFKID